jgi:hypothetical protein
MPCLATPDPRVDLGQSAVGASRRMADQAGERVGGVGPRHGQGVELHPEGTALGVAGRQHNVQRRSPASSRPCRTDLSLRGRRWLQGLASRPTGGHLMTLHPETMVPCRRAYKGAVEGSVVGRVWWR